MPRRPLCTGPYCTRAAVTRGCCDAHDKQRRRGLALTPLRGAHGQLGAEPLVPVSLRVTPACASAVEADPQGARSALERWAKRRRTR